MCLLLTMTDFLLARLVFHHLRFRSSFLQYVEGGQEEKSAQCDIETADAHSVNTLCSHSIFLTD